MLNAQAFDQLGGVVVPDTYRELCLGFTLGGVKPSEAIAAVQQVVRAIPIIHLGVLACVAEGDQVLARLQVSGTNAVPLFGIPATGRSFTVNMFDYARLVEGKIVERVQQSDNLGKLQQLCSGVVRTFGWGVLAGTATAGLWRLLRP